MAAAVLLCVSGCPDDGAKTDDTGGAGAGETGGEGAGDQSRARGERGHRVAAAMRNLAERISSA